MAVYVAFILVCLLLRFWKVGRVFHMKKRQQMDEPNLFYHFHSFITCRAGQSWWSSFLHLVQFLGVSFQLKCLSLFFPLVSPLSYFSFLLTFVFSFFFYVPLNFPAIAGFSNFWSSQGVEEEEDWLVKSRYLSQRVTDIWKCPPEMTVTQSIHLRNLTRPQPSIGEALQKKLYGRSSTGEALQEKFNRRSSTGKNATGVVINLVMIVDPIPCLRTAVGPSLEIN